MTCCSSRPCLPTTKGECSREVSTKFIKMIKLTSAHELRKTYLNSKIPEKVHILQFYFISSINLRVTFFHRDEFETNRQRTLQPSSKIAVFDYLMRTLYTNQQNQNKFTYTILNEHWFINNMVFYMRKNFYLLKEFDRISGELAASGLIDHWVSNHVHVSMKRTQKPEPSGLKFGQLQGIFEVWVVGMIMSLFWFVVELTIAKLKNCLWKTNGCRRN